MINIKEAYSIISKTFPGQTVTGAVDFDNDHFVFAVVDDPNDPPIGTPCYWVSKKNGEVGMFQASMDLDGFFKAVEQRSIDLASLNGG